jgi:hypothetical protein
MVEVRTRRPQILRRRLIPFETVDLAGDALLHRDPRLLVTRWRTIRPKKEFASGVSFWFLDRDYKVSRFYAHDGTFLYWYCDVLQIEYDGARDSYLMLDLLLDVRAYPDGRVEVLDEDELAEAHARRLVTDGQRDRAREILAGLLRDIGEGAFPPRECLNEAYW